MRRVALAAFVALTLAPVAAAATTPTAPVYDAKGHLVQTPYAPADAAQLTKKKASDIFLHDHKVAAWLTHYTKFISYHPTSEPKQRARTESDLSAAAGEAAQRTADSNAR